MGSLRGKAREAEILYQLLLRKRADWVAFLMLPVAFLNFLLRRPFIPDGLNRHGGATEFLSGCPRFPFLHSPFRPSPVVIILLTPK